mmetsp:Transcript_89400/g.123362  ORF Transcript_89400/g.123362 Transcript_89400/m.123362 type:complete len:121 (+) Transcript_89400:207-569(+)
MVKSSRFTWWNFFPIALAIQFMKLPNIFWLFNGCLQLFPSIRTNSPLSVFIPLAVIVAIGMLKEFIADNKRKQQDKKVNGTPCYRAKIGTKNSKHYFHLNNTLIIFVLYRESRGKQDYQH